MIHALEVLDPSGHMELRWDPTDPAEVARAREEVRRLRAAGYAFFGVAMANGKPDLSAGSLQVHHVDDIFSADVPAARAEEAEDGTQADDLPPEPGEPATSDLEATTRDGAPRCQGTTAAGRQCTRKARDGGLCGLHAGRAKSKARRVTRKTVAVPPMRGG